MATYRDPSECRQHIGNMRRTCTRIRLQIAILLRPHGGHHFDGMVTAARNFLFLAFRPDAASYALTRVHLAPVDSSSRFVELWKWAKPDPVLPILMYSQNGVLLSRRGANIYAVQSGITPLNRLANWFGMRTHSITNRYLVEARRRSPF